MFKGIYRLMGVWRMHAGFLFRQEITTKSVLTMWYPNFSFYIDWKKKGGRIKRRQKRSIHVDKQSLCRQGDMHDGPD
jgi:hypothetical protein